MKKNYLLFLLIFFCLLSCKRNTDNNERNEININTNIILKKADSLFNVKKYISSLDLLKKINNSKKQINDTLLFDIYRLKSHIYRIIGIYDTSLFCNDSAYKYAGNDLQRAKAKYIRGTLFFYFPQSTSKAIQYFRSAYNYSVSYLKDSKNENKDVKKYIFYSTYAIAESFLLKYKEEVSNTNKKLLLDTIKIYNGKLDSLLKDTTFNSFKILNVEHTLKCKFLTAKDIKTKKDAFNTLILLKYKNDYKKDKYQLTALLQTIGEYYQILDSIKNNDSVISYCQQSKEISDSNSFKYFAYINSKLLAKAWKNKGEKDSVIKYYELENNLSDYIKKISINSIEKDAIHNNEIAKWNNVTRNLIKIIILLSIVIFLGFLTSFIFKLKFSAIRNTKRLLICLSKSIPHDAKTPLKSIIEELEALKNECSDNTSHIDKIVKKAQSLYNKMIEMMTIQGLTESNGQIQFSFFSSRDKINKIVENLKKTSCTEKININEGYTTDLIYSNEILFESVICNIISNAIKHNDCFNKEVNINIDSQKFRKYVEISFRDNGKGIPSDLIKDLKRKIGYRFYEKINNEKSDKVGLVLTIFYVFFIKGDIKSERRSENQGSIIYITLPKNKNNLTALKFLALLFKLKKIFSIKQTK